MVVPSLEVTVFLKPPKVMCLDQRSFVYVRSKSCSHFEPSTDFSQAAVMVFPSSLNVPIKRCEKPGKSLHTFQTPSLRLIWYILETPRESWWSTQYVPAAS